MLKCVWVAARFVPYFGTPSFSPKTPNIGCRESFRSTNAFATSAIFNLSVLSLWTWRTIKWFSRQSEVIERRYVFTRFMAENDCSLTALVAGMTRRIFASTMTWDTKHLLHLMIAQTPPVLSHCQLLIQESTWESPAAPLTRPPWSHLYTTERLHPRVPQSPLLVGNVKTIPVYFWMRSSLFVR